MRTEYDLVYEGGRIKISLQGTSIETYTIPNELSRILKGIGKYDKWSFYGWIWLRPGGYGCRIWLEFGDIFKSIFHEVKGRSTPSLIKLLENAADYFQKKIDERNIVI